MVPSSTYNVSEAKGWVWGGITPPGPKSSRAWEMPSVLRAGYSNTVANVAAAFIPVVGTVAVQYITKWPNSARYET